MQTANATEITQAAPVTFHLEISCPTAGLGDEIRSLSSSFEKPAGTLLETGTVAALFPIGGPGTTGVVVWAGSPVVREYTVPLDYDSCKLQPGAAIAPDSTVTVQNVVSGEAWWWGNTFTCASSIVCRPPAVGTGATRTIGFWKTHVDALRGCIAGGLDLGFGALTVEQALGLLWANPADHADLQKAALLLGRQLLAASCNASQFGASPGDFTIAEAVSAIAARDCAAMMALYPKVDAFNNLNDNVALPFDAGASLGVGARDLAGAPGLPAGTCAP